VDGPAFDLITTMSKFLMLGMPLPDIIRAVTAAPADVVRRPDLGRFSPGAAGDVAILEEQEGDFEFVDVLGTRRRHNRRLAVRGMLVGGRVWPGEEAAA